ncbi:MAG TPA: preprotein translocase subunit SecY [Bdellovibrionota bacterium]|nr:preprotein translocase subunit SecY [Bdellovibrionota bacterium]
MANLEGLTKIPELKRRLLWSIGLLGVYRLGVQVPTPGIDAQALAQQFAAAKNTLFGVFNLFSGGALERFSIFALGIMPYISSSIILQLLTVVVPHLEQLSKEGELGRRKITQYTRYLTIVLSIIQGFGISSGLEQITNPAVVLNPGFGFKLMCVITLTSGTAFIMWLGEQITERGIGNGISLIIAAGIAARIPSGAIALYQMVTTPGGAISPVVGILLIVFMVAVVGGIIFMERSQRRIPVQYAKRVVGRRMYGGQSTHLPLRLNSAGVIPPIFASSLILFPSTIAAFWNTPLLQKLQVFLQPGGLLYDILFVVFIVFFTYFYTDITFKTDDVAENLKKHGGYVPGIRPGPNTADFLKSVLGRLTLVGAIYLSFICTLPMLLGSQNVPIYFGGTSLLILVGVALDTVAQIEAHLLARNYEGFIHAARIRGRRG